MKLFLITISTLFALSSCSSLSKEECSTTNWFELGKTDALDGESEPRVSDYRSACSKYGLEIKSMNYLKGFEVGLKTHCTYDNGLWRGQSGSSSHPLCEEASPSYKKAYSIGHKEFQAKKSIVELREELVESNGGKECSSSSDCILEGSCQASKCERSQEECSFDSDCKYEGVCESVSAWTDYSDNVSVDICKQE